jgi:hypothetical protein
MGKNHDKKDGKSICDEKLRSYGERAHTKICIKKTRTQ